MGISKRYIWPIAVFIILLCSILLIREPAYAAQSVYLYDGFGNPLSSTLSGGKFGLNIAGTINTTTAGANAVLSATQSVTTSESSLVAPANAFGVMLESESGNLQNIRWGFSNSAASILSSSLGILMEPGRDSSVLPMGAGTYLHLISTSGTQLVDVQWFLVN